MRIASPLFSDYAEKMRFIRVPDGSKILLDDENNFDLPREYILNKTFIIIQILETNIVKNILLRLEY